MIIVDMHTDTLTKVIDTDQSLYSNDYNIDFVRMKKHGSYIQTFAAYIDSVYCPSNALKRAVDVMNMMTSLCYVVITMIFYLH